VALVVQVMQHPMQLTLLALLFRLQPMPQPMLLMPQLLQLLLQTLRPMHRQPN
jgi:hypothetical protein